MDGVKLIMQERYRQIVSEGFNQEHDDEHAHGELSKAAVAYVLFNSPSQADKAESFWPWEKYWWKPDNKDAVRNLVKAGALIAAEIDRLQRMKG